MKKRPLSLVMDTPTRNSMFLLGGLLLLLVFVRLLTFPLLFPLHISPDQSMFVAIGEQLLQGKRLYVDVFDVNPPLAFYVHTVPAMVSRLFAIPAPQAFAFTIIACWLYSVGFSLWLVWRQSKHKEAFIFVPLVVSFSCLTLWLSQLDEFGQREHIFLLLFFPFFIVRWLRWNGYATSSKAAIVAGTFAAIGLFFKQYYLGAALILELLWFMESPRWRNLVAPETIVCVVLGVMYACCLLVMPQDVKDGYFSFMVPIFAAGYNEYGTSIMFQLVGFAQMWNDRIYLLIIACALGMAMMRYSTLIMPLVAFSLFALAAYLLQGQPWLNHALPFVAGSYMLIGVEAAIAACVLRQYALTIFRGSGRVFDIVCMVALVVWQGQIAVWEISEQVQRAAEADKLDLALVGYKGQAARADSESLYAVILRFTNIGDPVLFITRSIAPGYPLLLQTKREPASRYLHGMLLPTLLYASDNAGSELAKAKSIQAKMDGFRAKVLADYKADIRRTKPKLIMIQNMRIWDILEHSKFIEDPIFEQYQFAGVVDDHRIYIRRDVVTSVNR
jgi:hypothetical protein